MDKRLGAVTWKRTTHTYTPYKNTRTQKLSGIPLYTHMLFKMQIFRDDDINKKQNEQKKEMLRMNKLIPLQICPDR